MYRIDGSKTEQIGPKIRVFTDGILGYDNLKAIILAWLGSYGKRKMLRILCKYYLSQSRPRIEIRTPRDCHPAYSLEVEVYHVLWQGLITVSARSKISGSSGVDLFRASSIFCGLQEIIAFPSIRYWNWVIWSPQNLLVQNIFHFIDNPHGTFPFSCMQKRATLQVVPILDVTRDA